MRKACAMKATAKQQPATPRDQQAHGLDLNPGGQKGRDPRRNPGGQMGQGRPGEERDTGSRPAAPLRGKAKAG
jgi:hypothetical protein